MNVLKTLIEDLHRLDQYLSALMASRSGEPDDLNTYTPDVDAAADRLRALLGQNPDVIVRRFHHPPGPAGLICYVDNLVDLNRIDRDIVHPLLQYTRPTVANLPVSRVVESTRWDDIVAGILQGQTAVCLQGVPAVWLADTIKPPQRSIDRPETEVTVRGPQEAFSDVLAVQLSQVRRRLATPHLLFDQLGIGSRYPVAVAVAALTDVTNPALLQAVRDRLSRIAAETVVNGAMVASYLRDQPGALFPTVRNSERVDLTVWHLINGKVAVFVDGDPFVLTVPATLCDFYRTTEDYSTPWYSAVFVRSIRWLGWAFGLYLPAVYIALTEVNPDLVPPPLVILTAGSHTGLPFTPIVEVLVMILIIEILREAALRLPKTLGTTIGTVGAIVVGTAVVRAGFVSPQIIVVMTLTAISFFTAPVYDLTGTWRIVGWVMLVAAFVFGVYGIVLATIALSIKLVTETSFGVPYFSPLAPFRKVDWQNLLWRVPWAWFTHRSAETRPRDPHWNVTAGPPSDEVPLRHGQLGSGS